MRIPPFDELYSYIHLINTHLIVCDTKIFQDAHIQDLIVIYLLDSQDRAWTLNTKRGGRKGNVSPSFSLFLFFSNSECNRAKFTAARPGIAGDCGAP